MNRLMDSFRQACVDEPLAEKILLAPTRRIGAQWLGALARANTPAVNVHVETTTSLAMRIAGGALAERELMLLPGPIGALLVQDILREELDEAPASEGLAEAVFQTLTELRGAGLSPGDLLSVGFATASSGQRILRLLERFDERLAQENYIDAPGLFALAADLLTGGSDAVRDVTVLCPTTLPPLWTGRERTLWHALTNQAQLLDCDTASLSPDDATAASASLRQRLEAALGDRRESLDLACAQGAAAEVRAILRHCLEHHIPLDHVELLYTNRDTYLPLSYEQLYALFASGDAATYLEGIDANFSRPGRMLLGLCEFLLGNYSQRVLTAMFADGLFETTRPARQLAETLGTLHIGIGRTRWETLLPEAHAALCRRAEAETRPGRQRILHSQCDDLEEIQSLLTTLLAHTRELDDAPPQERLLDSAATLLKDIAACKSELDHLALQRLSDSLDTLRQWHHNHPSSAPLATQLATLSELVLTTRVGARGPQPGKLFVAPFAKGGHSGREHIFLVGLNDVHFPGAIRQDPLLLDDDRQRIIDTTHAPLPLSHHRLHIATEHFIALLGRCRGEMSISFASRDLVDDRELYPAMILLQLCAICRNEDAVDLEALAQHCPPAATYLPPRTSAATTATLALLSEACHAETPPAGLAKLLPGHLRRGQQANDAWANTSQLSAFNGKTAPEALDAPPIFSPSRLQVLAACPRRFFFQNSLALSPPEDLLPSADHWLEPSEFGRLLHDTFCEFYRTRPSESEAVTKEADGDALCALLETNIEAAKNRIPIPSRNAYLTTRRELNQAADVFLREEARWQHETPWRPTWLEASIGLKAHPIGETCGTDIDRDEPVRITLPAGTLAIRGQIDRIDTRADQPNTIAIWDYKSGSAKKYHESGPFDQGRILQHDLYARMAQAALPGRTIEEVGYYFTSYRGRGERVGYDPAELRDQATAILSELYRLFATGCFPATTDAADCRYCDYQTICGDVARVAKTSKQRLAECNDPALDPFRTLRAIAPAEETQ